MRKAKPNYKYLAAMSLLMLVSVIAVGAFIALAANDWTINVQNATMNFGSSDGEVAFGGTTNFDSLELSEDLSVGDDLTVTDDVTITGNFSADGIDEDWIEGTCADATTTPIQVVNPWGATAYVDQFLLVLQNGTTTITFDIGTSTDDNNLSTEVIADDVEYATSTYALLVNSAGTIAGTAGYKDPGTNSQEFFTWASGEYINMVVTETGSTGGVTGGANTFACTYKIHSFK